MMFGRERWPAAALAGGLVALLALAGCEREPSVASRSAAALRKAQEKGETPEGAAHDHGAMTPGGEPEPADAGHHEHEHTAPPGGGHGTAHGESAADHSGMGHGGAHQVPGNTPGRSGSAAHQAAHQDADHGGHAGMSHGQSSSTPGGKPAEGQPPAEEHTGHAGHGATPTAPPAADSQPSPTDHAGHSPSPEEMAPATADAAPQAVLPGQPAATLRPDPLDAPAATSVVDAQRSAEMAEEMAGGGDHGGHGSHGAGTYRHVDAGRGPGATEGSEKQTPGAGEHQHDPAPPPSGHEGHSHEPPSAAANEEAAVYACPMHPEVTSETPGTCPKCGMALVERRKE